MNREFSILAELESAELGASRGNPSERAAAAIAILKSKPNARVKFRNGEVEVVEENATRVEDTEYRTEASRRQKTDAGRRRRLEEHREKIEAPQADAFRAFLLAGKDGLDSRALSENTGSAGGFIVPQSFYNKLIVALKQVDGIFAAAGVVTTDDGSPFNVVLDDDSANVASIVAESGTSTDTDSIYDHVSFGTCPTWRSGKVRASLEWAQDSALDPTPMLSSSFGRRFARGIGAAHITTLLAGASLGVTTASPTVITGDELLDLMASVDPAYGANGSFLMNFTTYTALRKLKGSTSGDYLLPIDSDEDDDNPNGYPTLFGRPLLISPSLASPASLAKTVVYGDISRFLRREVRGLQVKFMRERYADFGQVGWEAFWRVDGAVAKAANSPAAIKYLQQHV